MRLAAIIIYTFIFSISLKAQVKDSIWVTEKGRKLSINTIEKDFGIIEQNEKTTFKFRLTNLNNDPLVIWHVTTSCGCTSPQWTEKPVKKSDDAIVKVKYDSSKLGVFNKSVYVYTNFDDKPIKLIIKGSVINKNTAENSTISNMDFEAQTPTTKYLLSYAKNF